MAALTKVCPTLVITTWPPASATISRTDQEVILLITMVAPGSRPSSWLAIMAVTADGTTLVVADSYRASLVGFTIGDDGSLTDRRVWADLGDHNPDGICLDADGAAWYADVPHEHCVRVREGGEVLETVELDRGAFACMLGGAEGRTLYTVGARWPGAAGLGDPTWVWDGQVVSSPAPAPRAGWPGGSH